MSDIFKPEKIQRIIIKISGEYLAGSKKIGFDNLILEQLADEFIELRKMGFSIGIVLGGGNLFRGAKEEVKGIDRITGDDVGMLATLQNSLILGDYIRRKNYKVEVFSAIEMGRVCRLYTPFSVNSALNKGKICFLAGGTGNPYFTTDTAAVLRAVELKADLVVKGTKVDGVFSEDPEKNRKAEFFSEISYDELLARRLNVMDMTAFSLARDYHVAMKICNITKQGNLINAILKKDEGTFIY